MGLPWWSSTGEALEKDRGLLVEGRGLPGFVLGEGRNLPGGYLGGVRALPGEGQGSTWGRGYLGLPWGKVGRVYLV